MSDCNKHARKILIQKFEMYRMNLQNSFNEIHFHMNSGALIAIADVLTICKHSGDGLDPIQSHEWIEQAQISIAKFLEGEHMTGTINYDEKIEDKFLEVVMKLTRESNKVKI